jgi:endonuclease G
MPPRRRRDDNFGGFNERDVESLLSAFYRLDPATRTIVLVALAVLAFVVLVGYYRQSHRQPNATRPPSTTNLPAPGGGASVQLLLGNPSDATSDPSNPDNYLMLKPYFALSYNNSAGEPNWVSWQVTSADLGNAPRKQLFDSDTTLPPGFKVVAHQDYSGSGFDRGHMCPHSDRAANEQMSYATFVMTNIIPQAPNVNQKAWAQLEMYSRDLAKRGNHLYIVSGPAGRGGRGSKGFADTIGRGKVAVPAECWKIIVVVPEGGDDLASINADTRVIAVDMPNDQEKVGEAWAGFRTSPAAIEQRTGYHFFTNLRPDVAAALRAKVDAEHIPPPRPMTHGGG